MPEATWPEGTCAGGVLDVAGLVVEEEVGLELAQELALRQAAEEHRLVDLDVPVHQRADRALVRRRAARGDERGADAHAVRRLVLQPMQRRAAAAGTGPAASGVVGLLALVRLEGVEAACLEDALGLVGEQHRVAVEGDAHLVRVRVGGARRVREDARRRDAGLERRAHVGLVGREEQVGGERPQVAPRRSAAREDAALDRHAVGLRRAEHAHARDRVVAREDHDLDALRRRVVEGEELLHQRERDARAWPRCRCARAAAACRRGRRWPRRCAFSSSKSNSARDEIATTS